MSAWLMTPELRKIRGRFPKNLFGGLQGLSAEETAMLLQDRLAKGGILSTLDLSQCYDRMCPQVSYHYLASVGWDRKLCWLFTTAWKEQVRFVQWQGATRPEPLGGLRATPQGCPMAPLVLCFWILAGSQEVAGKLRALKPAPTVTPLQGCYMDDRSAVCNTWTQTETWMASWRSWSSAVGLLENSGKTQVVAKSKALREVVLHACDPEWQRAEVDVLGTFTVSGPRENTDLEKRRLQKAKARQVLLGSAWLPWDKFVKESRSLCLSVAAYGWHGRLPTMKDSDSLFAAATVASASCRMANKHLRQAAYGAVMHLDCVSAANLLRKVGKLLGFERAGTIPSGDRSWTAGPGSSVHALKKWMSRRAWRVTRPWVWASSLDEACVVDLSPASRQEIGARQHAFPQGWRMFQIRCFLRSGRHEAVEMLARHSEEELLRQAKAVDFKSLRQNLDKCAANRTVMLGAFVSQAWLAQCEGTNEDHHVCPRCSLRQASFKHVCYNCTKAPIPVNQWQFRLGWPLQSLSRSTNEARLHNLTSTVLRLWQQRHQESN